MINFDFAVPTLKHQENFFILMHNRGKDNSRISSKLLVNEFDFVRFKSPSKPRVPIARVLERSIGSIVTIDNKVSVATLEGNTMAKINLGSQTSAAKLK